MAHLAHYREAHPLPFVITHWINLVSMFFLIITGFMIHFPILTGLMGVARGVHVFFGIIIFLNCVVRIVLAFFIKSAPTGGTRKLDTDYKSWLPQEDNKHQGLEWVKYYLFMRKKHPLSAKLGVPQKLAYLFVPILIILQFYTGMALWGPTMDWGIFAVGTDLVGGQMNQRIIHYFIMYLFIIFIFIHVYLANIEGTAPTKLMFFWKEHGGLVYDPDKHTIVGEDDLSGGPMTPVTVQYVYVPKEVEQIEKIIDHK